MNQERKHKGRWPRFSLGDILRIPVGLLFIYLSISAIRKAMGVFAWEFVPLLIVGLSFFCSLVFFGVGFVMAFGPFFHRNR